MVITKYFEINDKNKAPKLVDEAKAVIRSKCVRTKARLKISHIATCIKNIR